MAGDWIKMRVDLGDDPAVVSIARDVGLSEDDVVGKLHKLWSWGDRHTTDGFAPAITAAWIDRYIGQKGFADALVNVQWLSIEPNGVQFPNFDRHNGQSAKKRAENTTRQRLSRQERDRHVTGEKRTGIPIDFRRYILDRDKFTCVYCGEKSSPDREDSRQAFLTIDHLIPATRGGRSSVDNLASCCNLCNYEKADRTPEEWDLLPTFLAKGVEYQDGKIIESVSRKSRDKSATRDREQNRTEQSILSESTNKVSTVHVSNGGSSRRKPGLSGSDHLEISEEEVWKYAHIAAALFKRCGYTGPDGGLLWQIAVLCGRGLVSEALAHEAAEGARLNAKRNPVGFVRITLKETCAKQGVNLDAQLSRLVMCRNYPKGPPQVGFSDEVKKLAESLGSVK